MNREERIRVAQRTVEITEIGFYLAPSGRTVTIDELQKRAVSESRLYRPDDFENLPLPSPVFERTILEVTGETTLAAARRLVEESPSEDVLCLNFASARNPGGGVLSGAQAQEESLARSSGLYPCIAQMTEMYEFNRANSSLLYSDSMIHSPRVPVFCDDEGILLETPYTASFITAPAPNAGAVADNQRADSEKVLPTLRERARKVLLVAAAQGHATLVLGAWGCGVFRNDPRMVAEVFSGLLTGEFNGCFERVVFAVFDSSRNQAVIGAFRQVF